MEKVTLALLVASTIFFTVWAYKMIKGGLSLFSKWVLRHEYPGKKFMAQNKEIYTALVELRALTDADRAYTIQFHNGHEFLLSNPVWKLTCTHEVVRPGVTYEAANIQDLLVSRIADIIEPIITGAISSDGIKLNPSCPTCHYYPKCKTTKKFCVSIQIPKMSVGFSKFHLENQNIRTLVLCGMSNKRGAFGLVGVDFCGRTIDNDFSISEISDHVCRVAEKVQQSLQYKQAPMERVASKK